jgi:hypothetical protein
MSRKGQLAVFLMLAVAASLFGLLLVMKMFNVTAITQVKKTVMVSSDLSDQGTGLYSVLSREYMGKTSMRVLGESLADNYNEHFSSELDALKASLEKTKGYFYFDFRENPLGIQDERSNATKITGCGTGESSLDISLLWPSGSERVTSGFGFRNDPRPCYCHSGVDIASGNPGGGDDVFAAFDGVIYSVYAVCPESPNCFAEPDNPNCGCNGGLGNRIVIRHETPQGETFYTEYYHLGEIKKMSGKVSRGEGIALSGNTGRSSGPHLHFELSTGPEGRDEQAIDPCPLFDNQVPGCEQFQILACSLPSGSSSFEADIPLPGATENLKGKVVIETWQA